MSTADEVRGGDRQSTIVAVEMRYNEDNGNRDTVRWIWRWSRRDTGDRRDAGRQRVSEREMREKVSERRYIDK